MNRRFRWLVFAVFLAACPWGRAQNFLTVDLPALAYENAGTLSSSGTVTRSVASGMALGVNLSSSDTSELDVPKNVTIPPFAAAVSAR